MVTTEENNRAQAQFILDAVAACNAARITGDTLQQIQQEAQAVLDSRSEEIGVLDAACAEASTYYSARNAHRVVSRLQTDRPDIVKAP